MARRATMQTGVPMETAMMSHQLDQAEATAATAAGLTALNGVASMMVSHYSKQEE
jgi:hypothetical protein